MTLQQRRGPRPIANELQTALASPQHSRRKLVGLTMLTIYAVRCLIVHEGGIVVPKDVDEKRLVLASRDVLKVILMHLFRRRLGVVAFGR